MDRVRVAVVGVGHLGRHHARILAGLEGAELVGVADSRREQAEAIAGPLGARAFNDYRELLDQVDAVSIAVPTRAHRTVAGAFLERAIPTLVEKPLAATLLEAEQLVALARDRGALLQVGHIERFNPAFTTLAASGLRPKYVEADRLGTYTSRSTDIGVVHDLMIHDLDLLSSLIPSPVRSVAAVGLSLFSDREDIANARIEFEDGSVANLTASRASYQAVRKMRVWGPDGYAQLDFATKQAALVRPSERFKQGELDLSGVDLSQPNQIRDHIFGKVLRVDHVDAGSPRDALTEELEDFLNAVRTGAAPRVPGTEALRAMRLADQVLASLESHQWEGRPDGPIGPRASIAIHEAPHGLPAPKSWKYRTSRQDASRKI